MPLITFDINTLVLVINIFAFFIFGLDKLKAKKKTFRVPEAVLLLLALFFGGAGALFGMVVFNHKTSKMLFRIFVPLSVLVNYVLSRDSFYLLKTFLEKLIEIIPE